MAYEGNGEKTIQKRKGGARIFKKFLEIIAVTLAVIIGVFAITSGVGLVGNAINLQHAKSFESAGNGLVPFIDEETGCWTFITDREFKVLQLTDIHIGAGFLSIKKDRLAIDAVAELVQRTKPDLVIITGDMAYPVPFQSGTLNNKRETNMFFKLMESLGVYWTVVFGNHDSEVYSVYTREAIAEFYQNYPAKYCLFERSPKDIGIDGESNQIINIQNTTGIITQSLVMLDTHSYVDGSLTREYDSVHQNQVDWYKAEIMRLSSINSLRGGGVVKSLIFIHIPLMEYSDAWEEYRLNGKKDTANVKYVYGSANEPNEKVYFGKYGDRLFETVLELGSTQGIFGGHDHYNTFSVFYKGVRLTYGMSIDYLAYIGIKNETGQRGGTVIVIEPDSTFDCTAEPLAK